jgi:hypothetical protein
MDGRFLEACINPRGRLKKGKNSAATKETGIERWAERKNQIVL